MALDLIDLCRDKLYTQMASANMNLRILVGHSNLLGALIDELNTSPECYHYADRSDYANVNARCGVYDDSGSHDANGIPAYPTYGDTPRYRGSGYAGQFPATDSIFSRDRESNEDEWEEDDDWDLDDDEDSVFSFPPPRVLTVRNPDPDPDPDPIEQSVDGDEFHSDSSETKSRDDPTGTNPTSTSYTIKHPSTQSTHHSALSVSKRCAPSATINLCSKKPLLSDVKESWWKGGECVGSPVCV
ncbi:hypothetical protein BDW68DRAFT_153810 [Aspergillus falconensis]